MAFDANRDMRIEASETSEGRYALRTHGLAKRKRAELEIVGVPEPALHAAAGVLNMIAEYTVVRHEVTAGQTVGNALTVAGEAAPVLLVVRAAVVVPAKGGFFAALTGANKGVLRLVDVEGDPPAEDECTARAALATMLVHRARTRLAKDDLDGARKELDAALTIFPGDPSARNAPSLEGLEGTFNWQNHLAYEAMAEVEPEHAADWTSKADARRPR